MTHLAMGARAEKGTEEELARELPCAEVASSALLRAPGLGADDHAAGPHDMLLPRSAEQGPREVLQHSNSPGVDP